MAAITEGMHMIAAGSPMAGPNAFKLGVFAANADGGLALTTVPERWPATWQDIVAVAQMADRAGLEFILPIARWKGYGGETDARGHSFETLTHGAGLAALTGRIAIFATVHVPLVHPVFAAKAIATIDHISCGRAGLNIVCGWNQPEFDMFGVTSGDDRYAQGLEWHAIFARLLHGAAPFDFAGRFYTCKAVAGAPGLFGRTLPDTMSAAFSPPGRDFAAQTSDFLLTTFQDLDSGAAHIADIAARAAARQRRLGVFATAHVVVRETQAEAEDAYARYAVALADHAAVDNHMRMKQQMANSYDPHVFDVYRQRFAGGTGTYPLVGTPAKVAAEMRDMHRIGFAGTTLSFVNFRDELPFFLARVLPLLEAAGLRQPAASAG
jgi:alkanesulfonate monooxygenase SsuD/methylene tetrahydromethanopterin reductase-like flavin-dependent oxidoreductase (luciferase family)